MDNTQPGNVGAGPGHDAQNRACIGQLDPDRPWLAFMRPLLQRLSARVVAGQPILAALNAEAHARQLVNSRGLALSFVAQSALPAGCAYETFIDMQAQVPSRDNLHDLLNALIWLGFPRIKQQLNALQSAQIAQAGIGQVRGQVRDALTLFDENAAIVVLKEGAVGQTLAQALRQHDWQTLFVQHRAAFGRELQVVLPGHALLEKLCTPYKAITAHAWLTWADDTFFAANPNAQLAWIDEKVALELAQQTALGTRCFAPLPIAGVPGWWPQQDSLFYADKAVFRERSRRWQDCSKIAAKP